MCTYLYIMTSEHHANNSLHTGVSHARLSRSLCYCFFFSICVFPAGHKADIFCATRNANALSLISLTHSCQSFHRQCIHSLYLISHGNNHAYALVWNRLLQCMSILSLVWLCMQSQAVVVPGVPASAGTLLRAFVCLAALQACVNGSSSEIFHVKVELSLELMHTPRTYTF